MATLQFKIKKIRTKTYFVLEHKGLTIHLDTLNAVNFEYDFTKQKQCVRLSLVSEDKKEKTLGGVYYRMGHADHFYFVLQGTTIYETTLTPNNFREHINSTLRIDIPKYKRVQDAISDIIIESYSLAKHKKNSYFFEQNKQTFESEGEFYWAMKYLLLKSYKKLDKVFPTGWIFLKSDYSK